MYSGYAKIIAGCLVAGMLGAAGMAAASPGEHGRHAGTDRLIIKFSTERPNPEVASELMGKRLGWSMRYQRVTGVGSHVLKLDKVHPQAAVQALANQVAAQPGVAYAEPDTILRRALTPNDPGYTSQWHYYEPTGGINAPAAWDQNQGAGVTVAVLDTGYRPHQDLAANLLAGYDMISDPFVANDGGGRDGDASDPGDYTLAGECGGDYPVRDENSSWHGTHVAGTVAALTNNASGVAGVAYNAKVLPVRVLGRCGGYTSDIADAIVWSAGLPVTGVPGNAHPARVMNLSLGGGGSCSRTMQSAINLAKDQGSAVVVAAGNSASNTRQATPANCRNVIAVAATTRTGGRAYYSNTGREVDLSAPGGDMRSDYRNGVLSTLNMGTTLPGADAYAWYQGTSMATPHVSGVAALMLSAKPELSAGDVESLLKSSARAFPSSCSGCGSGILDADAAVTAAINSGGSDGGDDGDAKPCRGRKCR
ncbi:MAG: S8 family peptidase [Sedimenticola sp.]